MAAFVEAWAWMEERFLAEISQFEAAARGAVLKAVIEVIELDRITWGDDLRDLGLEALVQDRQFLHSHGRLIHFVSHLNVVIDPRSAWGSFQMHMLRLLELVANEAAAHSGLSRAAVASPTLALASDATLAWDHLRSYLYQMRHQVDYFSPELSENVELVGLLEAWNSSLAPAFAYVIGHGGRIGLCRFVRFIGEVKLLHPAFAGMLDERTPELFMMLPRLVLLRFREEPSPIIKDLAQFLPHRFTEFRSPCGSTYRLDPELITLMDDYARTKRLLGKATAARQLDGLHEVGGALGSLHQLRS